MSQSVVSAPPQDPVAPGRRRWYGLLVIALAQLMVVLDATIVNVALPSIKTDLSVSAAGQQWVITAYTLSFGGLLLLGGRVADYTGRRRTLVIGLIGFAAASAVGGTAVSFEMLLAARAVQGAFGALLAPAVLSLLSTTFTRPKERSTAFAVFGAVAASGSAVGLLLGGALTTTLNWHWVLYVNVPIALIAVAGALAFLDETRNEGSAQYDVVGALLATGGLVALVYGFSEAVTSGWTAMSTLGLLAAGVALLVAFMAVEARAARPLLPLWILRDRGRGGAYLGILLAFAGMFGVFLLISLYLQIIEGYSALETGLAYLPMTGAILISAGVASRLMIRVRPRWLMGPGLLLAGLGMALLTRLSVDSDYVSSLLPALILAGLGLGLVFPTAANLATHGVRDEDSGAASATLNTSQQVGGSLGVALLNTVAANATANFLGTQNPTGQLRLEGLVHGYATALGVGAAILVVAGVIALMLINVRLDDHDPAAA